MLNSLPTPAADPAQQQPLEPSQRRSGVEAAFNVDPVLCHHCGRTASNGLVCIGMCVADSGY